MRNAKKNRRRDFIKNTIKAGVGVTLLNTASSQAGESQKKSSPYRKKNRQS